MTISEPAKKIADSVIITAISRISMAICIPTICLLAWLYQGWQADKLDSVRSTAQSALVSSQAVAEKVGKVSDKMIVLETKQVQDAASSSRFQAEMFSRQDRMQDAIIGLSKSVSALTATVQALADNQRQQRSDRAPP